MISELFRKSLWDRQILSCSIKHVAPEAWHRRIWDPAGHSSLSLSEYWIMLGIEQDVFSGHVIWFNSDFLCAVGCVNIMSVHT
jgi:hypothetical protein